MAPMAATHVTMTHPTVQGSPVRVSRRAFDRCWSALGWQLAAEPAPETPGAPTPPTDDKPATPTPPTNPPTGTKSGSPKGDPA